MSGLPRLPMWRGSSGGPTPMRAAIFWARGSMRRGGWAMPGRRFSFCSPKIAARRWRSPWSSKRLNRERQEIEWRIIDQAAAQAEDALGPRSQCARDRGGGRELASGRSGPRRRAAEGTFCLPAVALGFHERRGLRRLRALHSGGRSRHPPCKAARRGGHHREGRRPCHGRRASRSSGQIWAASAPSWRNGSPAQWRKPGCAM